MVTIRSYNNNYYGRYEDLDNSTSRASGSHTIYLCPYCFILVGKEDVKGKLYYHNIKQVGFCHRCNIIIINESPRDYETLGKAYQESREKPNELEEYERSQVMYVGWSRPLDQVTNVENYLQGRGIYHSTYSKFSIRATTSPREALVFINQIIDDKLADYYQLRFLEGDIRHTSSSHIKKPLSWLPSDSSKIILCEGFTSALSLYQKIYQRIEFNPVVTQGKYLSSLQLLQLQRWSHSYDHPEIIICLDGGTFENQLKMAKVIYSKIRSGEIYLVNLPWKKDPNDLLKESDTLFSHVNNGLLNLEYKPRYLSYLRKKVYSNGFTEKSNRKRI